MKKIIVTDLDDTVVDWTGAFCDWISENYPNVHRQSSRYGTIDSLIRSFHQEQMQNILPVAEDFAAIKKLGNQFEFIAVSAAENQSYILEKRLQSLSVFGDMFDSTNVFHVGMDKRPKLEEIAYVHQDKKLVWVEDVVDNADLGVSLGYETYLINRPHNINQKTSATRVSGWDKILEKMSVNVYNRKEDRRTIKSAIGFSRIGLNGKY